MYDAEVGDDYYYDDPTVQALEERAAELLRKEAAMLVLSGTMGNLVSILAQTHRGDSVVVEETSHVFVNEAGSLATLGGLTPRTIKGRHGGIELEEAVFPQSILHPPTRMLCIENTQNAAGGYCLSVETTKSLCRTAARLGLSVHLDGARIFNAAVALGVPADELVEDVDSMTFCLSKGLACPVGSIVLGSRDFIAAARHWRQMVGGGMRQAGVFAAAGLVALDSMIGRLAEDHANAKRLATILADAGLPVDPGEVETNMVFVEFAEGPIDLAQLVSELKERGVHISPPKGRRIRFVTHYGISAGDVEFAGDQARRVFASAVARGGAARPISA
jgi:threonine aldolase